MTLNKMQAGQISYPAKKTGTSICNEGDLCKLCSDLLLIAIRIKETEKLGNPISLRKLIIAYIDKFELSCRECGIDSSKYLDAEYAIVALIDETILNIDGECRNYWISQPVQLEIFQNNNAGEYFFIKLHKLSCEPEKNRDVLEVYFLCMSLGFEGKYRVCNQQERSNILDDLSRKLRRAKPRGPNDLSFHIKSDNLYSEKKRKKYIPQIWVGAIFTTTMILLTYLILLIDYHSHVRNLLEALRK
jgi:type VI secretion system protein ImpK